MNHLMRKETEKTKEADEIRNIPYIYGIRQEDSRPIRPAETTEIPLMVSIRKLNHLRERPQLMQFRHLKSKHLVLRPCQKTTKYARKDS